MPNRKAALFAAAAAFAALDFHASSVLAAEAAPVPAGPTTVTEIIVTAQKRQENIQAVPMSITAATGDTLTKLGVADTNQLVKIVPGFNYTPMVYGTPVYTIRGVGFQDTSLGDSPTVSVYVDEAPLPFSAMTTGATLDLQRVEVLKGPQGTLFGENATGGAINYVAAKPTDTFQAGADVSYGRFGTFDAQGFVSGPITSTLDFRVAARVTEGGAWQQNYAPKQPGELGNKHFYNTRLSLQWKPTENFKALLSVSAWQDRSDPQAAQLFGFEPLTLANPLPSFLQNFPLAPSNARAASWANCINTSGHTYSDTPVAPGSEVPAITYSTSCTSPHNNISFYGANLRMDYDLGNDMTVTSLTSVNRYDRYQAIPGDGTIYQDYQSIQGGFLKDTYQELRLSGKVNGKGSWIVGANYEHDDTWDNFLQSYGDSTNRLVPLPLAPGVIIPFPLGPTHPINRQKTDTGAIYGNIEYPILDQLTWQGGLRYTEQWKSFAGCNLNGDLGNGGNFGVTLSDILQIIAQTSHGLAPNPVSPPYGQCASLGPIENDFHPELLESKLDQHNLAWRTGLKWAFNPDSMVYVNVSKGYKGGGFPTLSQSTSAQSHPVTQESLLAYEVGFKSTLLEHTLQANGAFFYYDYTDKQILGDILDPIFGALPSLVNIPKSRVIGFEFSGIWTPMAGLTITPSMSYQNSKVLTCSASIPDCAAIVTPQGLSIPAGHFHQFNYLGHIQDFNGTSFVLAPEWQANIDAEYDWALNDEWHAFVGANLNYQGWTTAAPGFSQFDIPAYTLLDLRAGVQKDAWRVQLWGRNVTNKYYWALTGHVNDTDLRYAGMPATYGVTVSYRFH